MTRIFIAFALLLCTPLRAQYFQFSQVDFSPQRVTPASVAGSRYALASLISRTQQTGGGFNLNSNMISLSYPIAGKKSNGWSGVGLSVMDDRTGQSGIFNTQEIGLAYAIFHFRQRTWLPLE